MPHPQKPLINPSCAAKCLSDNLFSRLEDRWETDVSKSDEYGRESVWSHRSHSDIWLKGKCLPWCNYTNILCFHYPLSPYVIASGGIHSHLSSDSLEDSQRTHIFSEIPQVFMENDKSDAHSVWDNKVRHSECWNICHCQNTCQILSFKMPITAMYLLSVPVWLWVYLCFTSLFQSYPTRQQKVRHPL